LLLWARARNGRPARPMTALGVDEPPGETVVTLSIETYLDETSLREILAVPESLLTLCSQAAYRLFQDGAYEQVAEVCRGLIAADHRNWYPHALSALALERQGRIVEALQQTILGLRLAPNESPLSDLYKRLRTLARL
jgi:hypothetical protein